MKKQIIVLLLAFSSIQATAQIKPDSEDFFFYDGAHVTYLNAPAGMTQEWFSNSHTFSVLTEWTLSKNFALGAGLAYSSQNFHNNMRIQSVQASGEEVYELIEQSDYENIEQTLRYVYVPLEIRLRGNPNENDKFFRFYLGLRTGLKVGSYAEYETDVLREKYYGLEDVARFRADSYVRIGYGYLSLFAAYGLTDLYEDGTVIDLTSSTPSTNLTALRPLSVGLSVSF